MQGKVSLKQDAAFSVYVGVDVCKDWLAYHGQWRLTGARTCSTVPLASASRTSGTGRVSDSGLRATWIASGNGQISPFIDCDSMAPEPRSIFGVVHVLITWVLGIS
jgi:hypothetical protein